MAGRPPKPVEMKKRQGTYRPDRDPSNGNLAVVPAYDLAVHELGPAQALDVVLDAGAVWIASTDAPAVALLRDALLHLEEMRSDPRAKPADIIMARKAAHSLLSELGFSPTARAKLGLAEVKAKSKLDELADRQAKRRGG